jgi:hypothetical protein
MSSTIRTAASVSALAFLTCALPVRAQQPASAAAVPPPACEKPADFAPLDRSDHRAMTRFQKGLDDYKTCIGDYSKTNGAKANELAAQSRVYADAANKAIDDFNAYIQEMNAKAAAAGDDNKSNRSPSSGGGAPAPKY